VITPEQIFRAAEVLAPVLEKVPDALQKLVAWGKGGPVPVDVLDALPDSPDLTRGDLELEAMKRRAVSP
jgi:hypothetical protein